MIERLYAKFVLVISFIALILSIAPITAPLLALSEVINETIFPGYWMFFVGMSGLVIAVFTLFLNERVKDGHSKLLIDRVSSWAIGASIAWMIFYIPAILIGSYGK